MTRFGPLPAALAALAMLVQLLIPAASMAYEAAQHRTRTVVLCTPDGAVTTTVPDAPAHHKGFAGLKCHDCVMASVAAVQAGDALLAEPVRYIARAEIARPGEDRPAAAARAPPRPPSTAPPVFPNV